MLWTFTFSFRLSGERIIRITEVSYADMILLVAFNAHSILGVGVPKYYVHVWEPFV
jgi:hypothetical protein